MKIFKKPIFVSISPNAQADDVWLALKLMFVPWRWKEGKEIGEFETALGDYLSEVKIPPNPPFAKGGGGDLSLKKREGIVAFESGRTALYAILQAMGVGRDDEVLIQALTCTAAVNPILWIGAKPIYVDLEPDGFNIFPEDLEKKITPKSRVVIIQHTFGFPARMDELLSIAKKHNLLIIEDCAHSLGAAYKGRQTGTFGEAAIFSFGRSKVISTVFGGAAFSKNPELAKKIREIQKKYEYPSYRWIAQQLFHPIYFSVAKLFYNFLNIGKLMVVIAKKIGLISVMVYPVEKSGGKPFFSPAKMPNALAILGLNQMKKLERFNEHRRELAGVYRNALRPALGIKLLDSSLDDHSAFLNFPIRVNNYDIRRTLIGAARARGIHLESWPAYGKNVIGPDDVCQGELDYADGSCPNAERAASVSINLPTGPNTTLGDAERVAGFLKEFFTS